MKANRGAAGPDGMRIADFPDLIRCTGRDSSRNFLDGSYRPEPVRREVIPKPDGSGERMLGIPNVLDRVIQQAVQQVLTPIFDPDFSESSFGLRTQTFRTGSSQAGETVP